MGTQRLRNPELYENPVYLDLIARLAANTRRLRAERGWTQEQAAERCSMATLVLQTVESGRKNFTGTVVARLCQGFGVDVREFFAPAAPLARRNPGRPQKVQGEGAEDDAGGDALATEVSVAQSTPTEHRPASPPESRSESTSPAAEEALAPAGVSPAGEKPAAASPEADGPRGRSRRR